MANKPADSNSQFQPAFKRVAQTSELDDALACAAMLSNRPLDQVRTFATTKFQIPTRGVWYLSEGMLADLMAHYGFIASSWQQAAKVADLPDLCLVSLDFKENTAAYGRHALFHRNRDAGGIEYVIDPHPAIPAAKQVRIDLSDLTAPIHYMGLKPIKAGK